MEEAVCCKFVVIAIELVKTWKIIEGCFDYFFENILELMTLQAPDSK